MLTAYISARDSHSYLPANNGHALSVCSMSKDFPIDKDEREGLTVNER